MTTIGKLEDILDSAVNFRNYCIGFFTMAVGALYKVCFFIDREDYAYWQEDLVVA